MGFLIVSDVGFAFRIDKLPSGALADCVLRFAFHSGLSDVYCFRSQEHEP